MVATFWVGMGFGLTSAIITTLGVIVGLGFGLDSKLAMISAVLTIAIADSLSDALGVHIAKEAEGNFSHHEFGGSPFLPLFSSLFFLYPFCR